jgi:energy-coupling factor transporter ATP-binding protein EcfA2
MSTEPSNDFLTLLSEISSSATKEAPEAVSISIFPTNPFVGLRPFNREEDLLFFGRGQQVIELLRKLKANRFLAIVGTSGCGKSSLIQAGLIPKLKAGFLVETRDQWRFATTSPGDSPLRNLATAIMSVCGVQTTDESVTAFVNAIRCQGAAAIVEQVWPLSTRLDANLLVLVDQFEEIYRFGEYARVTETGETEAAIVQKREEANEFVNVMLQLAKQDQVPIHVVLAMRSDFLGDCDNFFGLPEAMNRSQYLVPRLTRKQQQEAIEGPIFLMGKRIGPRLLDRVLNDVGEESDQLPIMQHALMRTWDEWLKSDDAELDLNHYEAVGTINDALSRDAEKALEETGNPTLTKKIFQVLTDRDEHGRRIRRPASVAEIESITGADQPQIMAIIERFREKGRSFLAVYEGKSNHEQRIDISHESLIRQWTTLRNWVDEEAESREMYLRLSEAAARHQARKEGAWRNPGLQLALDWRKQHQPNESWAQRYNQQFPQAMAFLDKSRRRRRLLVFSYCVLFGLGILMLSGMAWYRQRGLVAEAKRKETEIEILQSSKQTELQLLDLKQQEELQQLNREQEQKVLTLRQQEAEQRTQIAEAGKREAEAQRVEAERQRKIAEDKTREAQRQTDLYQAQLRATEAAKQDAVREREEAQRQRDVADRQTQEAKRQADEADKQRQAALAALKQKDAEQKEKEEAQQKLAKLEEERRKDIQRREEYHAGKDVVLAHPLLGNVPYHQGKDKALEVDEDWIDDNIVSVQIPELNGIVTRAGGPVGKISFHKCGLDQLRGALREISEKGLLNRILTWDRTFATAKTDLTAKYRDKPVAHFLGLAFDINGQSNPTLRNTEQVNSGKGSVLELVPIFEKYGFKWGGNGQVPFLREPAHFELIRIDNSERCLGPRTSSHLVFPSGVRSRNMYFVDLGLPERRWSF